MAVLWGLSFMVCSQGADSLPRQVHQLTWTYLDWAVDHTGEHCQVTFDGKVIGNARTALDVLSKINLERNSILQVTLPPETRLPEGWQTPAHSVTTFIRKARIGGVAVEYYLRGSKLEIHTLTWRDYLEAGGGFKANLDDASVVFDGENIGKVPAALRKLDKYPWKAGSILQIICPEPWPPPGLFAPFSLDGLSPKAPNGVPIIVDTLFAPDSY
jgi:hypothetical protein